MKITSTHEAADAFWKYWRENGEPHKHGYYESTWGAINAALLASYKLEKRMNTKSPPIEIDGAEFLAELNAAHVRGYLEAKAGKPMSVLAERPLSGEIVPEHAMLFSAAILVSDALHNEELQGAELKASTDTAWEKLSFAIEASRKALSAAEANGRK